MGFVGTILKFGLGAAALILATVFAVRAVDSMRGEPLSLWHSYVPKDAKAAEIDAMDWAAWMARESSLFQSIRTDVTDKLPDADRIPQNRYFANSPVNPANLETDWNRSFILMPAGSPEAVAKGAVVLLHGLTDAPYSLRHIALAYQARGWVAVGIRMPGHGTVPAGLTKASMADWQAATRLAVREAQRLAPGKPLHFVGYSNGGALAITHALESGTNAAIGKPDRIILFSPMIGLTQFARFAGLASWPAIIPAFNRAAWLGTVPEYNPYKYNSFPVKAAVESNALTADLRRRLEAAVADGSIARFPQVIAFQSAVDSTVSARAVVSGLFDRLPANGSTLVLFDVNRAAPVGPLLRPAASAAILAVQSPPPHRYRTIVVENAAANSLAAVARTLEPGSTTADVAPLPTPFPANIYSLGHIALPFPLTDGLYGLTPDPADRQGAQLGALAVRGESGQLGANITALTRISSNPFFPLILQQLGLGPENVQPTLQGAPQ